MGDFRVYKDFVSVDFLKTHRFKYVYRALYCIRNMEQTISVRVEKDVLKELGKFEKRWHTERSVVIRKLLAEAIAGLKVKNALDDLKEGIISIGKASEDAGVNIWEMIDLAKKNNVDWVGYSEEDLGRDLELLKSQDSSKNKFRKRNLGDDQELKNSVESS